MLRALSGPLLELSFFPTAGINADLKEGYLKLGCVSCVGGSWFIPVELLAASRFNDIKILTVYALQLIHVRVDCSCGRYWRHERQVCDGLPRRARI